MRRSEYIPHRALWSRCCSRCGFARQAHERSLYSLALSSGASYSDPQRQVCTDSGMGHTLVHRDCRNKVQGGGRCLNNRLHSLPSSPLLRHDLILTDHICTGPIGKEHHLLSFQGSGLQRMDSEDMIQPQWLSPLHLDQGTELQRAETTSKPVR